MMTWLAANFGTILVGLIILAVVAAVVRGMVNDRKKGKSSCSCGCAGCPHSGSCHPKN